jgi:23S rRNA pseudouridine1911/1915/1917 synthase
VGTYNVRMNEEATVIARLTALYPQAKKNTLRSMLESRRVLINGVPARSMKQPVGGKDKLEVLDVADAPVEATRLGQGLMLVFFDSEIVIVEKPYGLLTSTHAEERRPTAWRILQAWFRKQNNKNEVHLIHRLDRDASGLLVFARTWDAYSSLKQQFFEHTITRQYEVLVHGVPKAKKGRLENLLIEDEHGFVKVTKDLKAGKLAILDYEVMGSDRAKKISHLKCTLFTGRKHQIRVQLAAAGHKVLGDPMYGDGKEAPGRLALHAGQLAFKHPRTRREVSFVSPMPGSFAHLMRT